jgi:hypothetical protein
MEDMNMAEIIIPKGYYNYGITTDNYFIADTNDSANWEEIRIKLLDSKSGWRIDHCTEAPHQIVIHLVTNNIK